MLAAEILEEMANQKRADRTARRRYHHAPRRNCALLRRRQPTQDRRVQCGINRREEKSDEWEKPCDHGQLAPTSRCSCNGSDGARADDHERGRSTEATKQHRKPM